MKKAILSLALLAAVMLMPRSAKAAETESLKAGPISMSVSGSGEAVSTWKRSLDGLYLVHVEKKSRVGLLLPAVQAAREAARKERIEFKLKSSLDPDCEPEEIGRKGTFRLGRQRGDKREVQVYIPTAGDCDPIQGLAVLPRTKQAPPTKDGPD